MWSRCIHLFLILTAVRASVAGQASDPSIPPPKIDRTCSPFPIAPDLNCVHLDSPITVDGTLVRLTREADHAEVYAIWGGAKFLVTGSYPIDPSAIRDVTVDAMKQFAIIPRDGTLVQELNGLDTFVFRNGKKVRIPNDYELARAGLHSRYIRIVPADATSRMPTADWFTLPQVFPGDLNVDGARDCVDLGIVKASFGKREPQSGFDPRADVNGDGIVDVRDLAFVAQKLGAGASCDK